MVEDWPKRFSLVPLLHLPLWHHPHHQLRHDSPGYGQEVVLRQRLNDFK